ncbi:MAG: hypothetical protein ACPGGK_14595, partial [Pikeienuella sp.]
NDRKKFKGGAVFEGGATGGVAGLILGSFLLHCTRLKKNRIKYINDQIISGSLTPIVLSELCKERA